MNKNFLTIAASLAVTAIFLSSAPVISDSPSTSHAVESRYTATFHSAPEPKVVTPGGTAEAELPDQNVLGFNSWLFLVSRIPCFPVDEVELEPDVRVSGEYVPVLSFDPNPGWVSICEEITDDPLTTVYFYTTPVPSGSTYTPLFNSWTLTNFKVRNGVCGSHSYVEIIEKVNEAGLERYSLQSDNISGSPADLWSMVR